MIVRELTVKNASGLQSKSAAIFIQKASNYKSSIWITKEDRRANAKSLLGVLSLNIGPNTKILLSFEGEDENKAAEELERYLVSD